MSYQSNYTRGQWLVICEACGRKYKNTELRQRWDGFMVCEDDWEPRQPQDFVRGVADYQAPPWTRPEQGDVFEPVTLVYTPDGTLPISPLTSPMTVSMFVSLIKAKPTLTGVVTSTVTMLRSLVRGSRVINGFLLNNTTLG